MTSQKRYTHNPVDGNGVQHFRREKQQNERFQKSADTEIDQHSGARRHQQELTDKSPVLVTVVIREQHVAYRVEDGGEYIHDLVDEVVIGHLGHAEDAADDYGVGAVLDDAGDGSHQQFGRLFRIEEQRPPRRPAERDGELMHDDINSSQGGDDRPHAVDYRYPQVIVGGLYQEENERDENEAPDERKNGDVFHPLDALKEPDGEQPLVDAHPHRKQVEQLVAPDVRNQEQQPQHAEDEQQEERFGNVDRTENPVDLRRVVAVDADAFGSGDVEAPVDEDGQICHDGLGIDDRSGSHLGQDTDQVGIGDQRNDQVA